jgi:hypothetical protein
MIHLCTYQFAFRCSDLVFCNIWKKGIELADLTTHCNGCGKCSGELCAADGSTVFVLSLFRLCSEESTIQSMIICCPFSFSLLLNWFIQGSSFLFMGWLLEGFRVGIISYRVCCPFLLPLNELLLSLPK